MYTIGIDIGGTNLRIGLLDENNRLSCYEQHPQNAILKETPPDELADFIELYIKRHATDNSVAAICAAFPAAIDKDRAVVLNAPNINGFNGVNIKSLLQKKLGYPIVIEKDVNALLFYDLYQYKVDTAHTVIACYVGTGLGNAIYINGKILTGYNGVAGELGHIPAWNYGAICSCGNKGCAETYVGGKYLSITQQKEFPETPIERLFAAHGSHPLLTEYIQRLAATIATEINILDPKTVILGGGVLSMDGFPKDMLTEYIRRYTRKPLPEANLSFVYSENSGENGVIGAGALAWDQIRGGKTS